MSLQTRLAALITAIGADIKALYAGKVDKTTITAAGGALLDDADAAAQRTTLGLGSVDNTSDADKPVSTAQATAIGLKQDTLVSGTNIKTINGTSLLGSGDVVTGDVTLTDTQTLTNKTIEAGVFTNGYTEEVYALTGTEINPVNGSIQTKTLTANTTFTESLADGQSVVLMLNPSTFTTTWPTLTWIGTAASTAPTLIASVYNCLVFFQMNGTLYGRYVGRV